MTTKPVVLRSDLRVVYEVLDKEGRNVRDMIGREASVADLVAVLIAEGGETIWWCETHHSRRRYDLSIVCEHFLRGMHFADDERPVGEFDGDCRLVQAVVYGPIPAEEETTT